MEWPFEDPPNTAVFTSRRIIEGDAWVYYVTHDADDGAWQFHPQSGPTPMEESRVVALGTMVSMDARLAELVDLPLGWHAWRGAPDAPWQRAAQEA